MSRRIVLSLLTLLVCGCLMISLLAISGALLFVRP
jgi:hypothetical protein